ncbi:MAG: DNA polymerase III subunit delta [Parcubacteria group bacterium Gr01-1014_44]|nr:MAG: DNA polymerase III subunit delta [Parcubacteria group bacterium Gr01-1014_44]
MNLTFYYGADSFRIKEAMEKKIASFLAKNNNGVVEKLDFEAENCLEDVENILKRRSFFNEPELVMVYAYFPAKDLQKKDEKLFKFLSKEAKEIKEFESLRGAGLEKWALEKITQAGFTIKTPVLKKLVFRIISQGQLSQEIEKLVAYQSYHGKKEIEDKTIDILVKTEAAVNNFALIDALGTRDTKKAVTFLNQALSEGSEPQAVLGQIIYQFRNLLKVKSLPAVDLAKAGLHPFVAQKTSQQAKQFELVELKKVYHRLAELDVKSKNGQIDLIPALFEFLLYVVK